LESLFTSPPSRHKFQKTNSKKQIPEDKKFLKDMRKTEQFFPSLRRNFTAPKKKSYHSEEISPLQEILLRRRNLSAEKGSKSGLRTAFLKMFLSDRE